MKNLPDQLTGLAGYPFERNYYVRPDGLALQYVDEGKGPAVVMAHGNPTWSFFFRNMINDLSSDHRCLVPDHMGMGLSSRPTAEEYGFRLEDRVADMEALMDHWNIDGPVHFVVHDWGGPIALSWAAAHPERVASVTIMNSGTRIPDGYHLPVKLGLFKYAGPLGQYLAKDLGLFVNGTAVFGASTPLSREAKDGLTAPYRTPESRLGIARFVADIPLDPIHPSYACLGRIDRNVGTALANKPISLVWGLEDFVFTRTVYLDWRKRFPQAEGLVLPEAGHYLLEDDPQRVCSFVRKFIVKSENNERSE